MNVMIDIAFVSDPRCSSRYFVTGIFAKAFFLCADALAADDVYNAKNIFHVRINFIRNTRIV